MSLDAVHTGSMTARTWVIISGFFLSLLVIPPLPGYWLETLGAARWPFLSNDPLWQQMVDPLRFLGSVMAWSWTLVIRSWTTIRHPYMRSIVTFFVSGTFYAIPGWVALLGANPSWAQALWLVSISSVSEWAALHAPVAGALCVVAAYLLKPRPEPEPIGLFNKLLRWTKARQLR